MSVDYSTTEAPFGPIVNGTQIVFYQYRPNEAAAYTFVATFGALVLAHIFYFFYLRAWRFLPLIVGLIGEAFGYYGRAWAHKEPNVAGPFILQNLLILGMAPLVAATVYTTLGAFVKALDLRPHMSISPKLTTCFYIIVDIGCFVTQVFGSVVPASGDPDGIRMGRIMITGGLIAQLVALTLFLFSTLHVHHLARRHAPAKAYQEGSDMSEVAKYFWVTYVVTAVMMVRSLVRGIEYLEGEEGFIIKNEVFVYVFDALLIAAIAFMYLFIHPGRMLRDAPRVKEDVGMVELIGHNGHRHDI